MNAVVITWKDLTVEQPDNQALNILFFDSRSNSFSPHLLFIENDMYNYITEGNDGNIIQLEYDIDATHEEFTHWIYAEDLQP